MKRCVRLPLINERRTVVEFHMHVWHLLANLFELRPHLSLIFTGCNRHGELPLHINSMDGEAKARTMEQRFSSY